MNTLTKFFNDRGSSASTKRHYLACVKLYEELNNLTLDSLIEEADKQEEERIRWKNRALRERLIQFRNYLYTHKSEGTAKLYLTDIKTIYRHFEIELQDLPSFNSKQIKKTYEMTYEDLITKKELIDAYHEANNVTKCIILFGMSSGFSKIDLLDLKVSDFIKACEKYIKNNELREQLIELKNTDEILIPTFRGERKKTSKKFITFCSPEAAEHIVQYLLGREASKGLDYSDALFDISDSHLSLCFRKINEKLELGQAGEFSRFRCHMLRKYQASTLLNFEEIGWTVEEIDTLQGRSMDKTHRAYFHNDGVKLFKKYMDSVDELMLFKSIHTIDKAAFEKLTVENETYKKELEVQTNKINEQELKMEEIIATQKKLEMLLGQKV